MRTVRINTAQPYDVLVGRDITEESFKRLSPMVAGKKVLVVTDDKVPKELWINVMKLLGKSGASVYSYILPSGESSKSIAKLEEILNVLAHSTFTRSDAIIAVGGGVVGDISGLAASLYMRGINYVQMPTTLLAAIDSSVGGKTAVDLKEGKNLVGTFYQPSLVICDIRAFDTLPAQQIKCGMGEGVKYGLLVGGNLWRQLLAVGWDGRMPIFNDGYTMEDFVADCVEYKGRIVSEDEKESGLRRVLNLGHTFGHAIEVQSGYAFSHGYCVACGLVAVMELFPEHSDEELVEKVKRIYRKLDINCISPFTKRQLVSAMNRDKKADADGINFVFVMEVGKPYCKKITYEQLNSAVK